jgi:sporulation protein YlmC with PRC-barrel domain
MERVMSQLSTSDRRDTSAKQERSMLWNASAINGYAIAASDGHLGTVSDFLFDDKSWMIRWLVVDTGTWLPGRKVLLPPMALGHPNAIERVFPVRLTRQQVKDSPDIDTDRPVSRQMETHVYDYYGWNPYWDTGLYMGGYGFAGGVIPQPAAPSSQQREAEEMRARQYEGDAHLRSIKVVTGYHIHATDGEIGHVEDVLVDDTDWGIRFLIVNTSNWWSGNKVLISPRSAGEIDWSDKLVNLHVDRQRVKDSPAYDESMPVDRAYERRFHDYYGGGIRPGDPP